jgi:2'-5' RNA ligase
VYSLNAAVPGRVRRLADELQPALLPFESIRDRHSILIKRLGGEEADFQRLSERSRQALAGTPPIEVRIDGIDYFEHPTRGPAPVVYLAVESPGLEGLHERLVDELGAVGGLEGPDYTMHVTLARGGDLADARNLAERSIEPVSFTISELQFYDARHDQVVRRIPLPA